MRSKKSIHNCYVNTTDDPNAIVSHDVSLLDFRTKTMKINCIILGVYKVYLDDKYTLVSNFEARCLNSPYFQSGKKGREYTIHLYVNSNVMLHLKQSLVGLKNHPVIVSFIFLFPEKMIDIIRNLFYDT